jgi:hypothetical protein
MSIQIISVFQPIRAIEREISGGKGVGVRKGGVPVREECLRVQ